MKVNHIVRLFMILIKHSSSNVESLMFPSLKYTLQKKKYYKPSSFKRAAYGTKIVSRQKHNMLSLLHTARLKLLVFYRASSIIALVGGRPVHSPLSTSAPDGHLRL